MTGRFEERFFEIQCMKCKKIGLLSSGLCRHGCGTIHNVKVEVKRGLFWKINEVI